MLRTWLPRSRTSSSAAIRPEDFPPEASAAASGRSHTFPETWVQIPVVSSWLIHGEGWLSLPTGQMKTFVG